MCHSVVPTSRVMDGGNADTFSVQRYGTDWIKTRPIEMNRETDSKDEVTRGSITEIRIRDFQSAELQIGAFGGQLGQVKPVC